MAVITRLTRFNKVSGKEGVYVGEQDAEVKVADATNGGTLYIGGSPILATAAELNAAAGTGVDSGELDLLDGAIAGTVVANKAVAAGADKNVDVLAIADLKLGSGAGTSVTSTAAELNILDGVTSTAAELNILDGVTSTAAELNILDGVTSTAAELNILDGVTSTAAELNALDGITSTVSELNILDGVTSSAAELNILTGVTSTSAELNVLDGITSTVSELNILDGVTSSAAELNILTGVTSTSAELNILDGVTSTAAELNIVDGVTATAAEINTAADVSTQVETVAAAGALTGTITNSKLALVGAGAVTLAAPSADMLGKIKLVEMTVDNGDVTLALTNVDGGTNTTTCTWANVGEALILVGGVSKWHVFKELGVVLT
jgi:hypothetical protein